MRKELEEKLHIKAYDIYGLTEICGPGVGGECECQNGTHLWEDHFFPEIIDPVTLKPVEPGQQGELVFTTLTKEGMPMIRYRTRDLTHLIYDKCDCGRTAVRMGRILGRSDDMLIIRGVNVFPSTVESILLELPEFEPQYMILVDRVNNTDTFQIQVEVRPEYYSDEMNKMLALKKKIASRMQSIIGLQPDIKIVEPRSIERSMGKAKHDAGGETRAETVKALPMIIEYFLKKGYTFTTLPQILGESQQELMPEVKKGKEYYVMQANLALAELTYEVSTFLAVLFVFFIILGMGRLFFMVAIEYTVCPRSIV